MGSPSLLAAVPLAAGVAVAGSGLVPSTLFSLLLIAGWCGAAIALTRRATATFVIGYVCGCTGAGGVLAAHADRAASHTPVAEALAEATASAEPVRVLGVLRDDASVSGYGVTVTVDAIAAGARGRERTTRGGIRATIAGTLARPRARAWRQGRTIAFDAIVREPTAYRDFGVPDDRVRLARQGIALVATIKSGALVSVTSRASIVDEAASALRAYVRAAIQNAVGRWSEKSAGIVTAILIGDRSGLDPDDERRLQEAGTYHVIAISGGNIALLTTLLVAAGRVLRQRPRRTAAWSIGLLAFYGYAAGLAPSVMRATLAGVVYLAARVLDHRGTPMNALGVAATIALAANPLSLLDPGFLLSFGATVAIVIAAARLTRRPARNRTATRSRTLARSAMVALALLGAATLCAEIALVPIGARLFGRISFAGLVLNFAAIPLMSVIQIAGLAAVVVYPVSNVVAFACGGVAHAATIALLKSAALIDVAPWLVLDVPPPSAWTIGCWYVAWTAVFVGWNKRRLRPALAVCVVAVGATIVWSPAALRAHQVPAPADGWMRVAFLDVGQGDATVVIVPGAAPLLVDAGGAPGSAFDLGRRVTVPSLWALGVTKLGGFVVTHGDPDHVGGAPAVVRALAPAEVWEGVPVPAHVPLQQLHAAAAGSRWQNVRAGNTRQWGSAQIRVLHPPEPEWERQKVRNDDSIVLDVRFGRVSVLLPGDIGMDTERILVPMLDVDGRFTIVKAPHHGSAGSSSQAFVDATHPSIAIFSAGRRNPFGHPSAPALERYRSAGAAIFRTDVDGEVIVETDGTEVVVWSWTGRRDVRR